MESRSAESRRAGAPGAAMRAHRRSSLVVLSLVIALSALVPGCGKDTIDVPPVSAERPAEPRKPATADLSTPEKAVQSYLDYLSYAYLLGKSDVASQTMGPEEFSRVDSYIELDRQRNRKIDQQLKSITFGKLVAEGADRKLVPAQEEWTYRYVDLLSGGYKGAAKKASFTATYTVERGPRGWLVTSVEATSSTPIQ
jgi:hypothetical protein